MCRIRKGTGINMENYTSKIISVEKALELVKSDSCIVTSVAAGEPQLFLSQLPVM